MTDLNSSPNIEGAIGHCDGVPEELRLPYDESVDYLADMYKKLFKRFSNEFEYILRLATTESCSANTDTGDTVMAYHQS